MGESDSEGVSSDSGCADTEWLECVGLLPTASEDAAVKAEQHVNVQDAGPSDSRRRCTAANIWKFHSYSPRGGRCSQQAITLVFSVVAAGGAMPRWITLLICSHLHPPLNSFDVQSFLREWAPCQSPNAVFPSDRHGQFWRVLRISDLFLAIVGLLLTSMALSHVATEDRLHPMHGRAGR